MYERYPSLSIRRDFTIAKINELKDAFKRVKVLQNLPDLCIYCVGSIGRMEACAYSDLDIFFINRGESPVSKINQTILFADTIQICRDLGFPEFSNDGEFIKIHDFNKIKKEMGSPLDDYKNYFSARLLLILESQCLFNERIYDKILNDTIDIYYKDFHSHEVNFRPVFLVNDIIRFWRSMTLLYENRRARTFDDIQDNNLRIKKKNETHLKNFKLKFSRQLICSSFLLQLLEQSQTTDKNMLIKIIKMSPLERILNTQGINEKVEQFKNQVIDDYVWFLDCVNKDKQELIAWIGDKNNRNAAFEKARMFHKNMGKLILNTGEKNQDLLVYLLL